MNKSDLAGTVISCCLNSCKITHWAGLSPAIIISFYFGSKENTIITQFWLDNKLPGNYRKTIFLVTKASFQTTLLNSCSGEYCEEGTAFSSGKWHRFHFISEMLITGPYILHITYNNMLYRNFSSLWVRIWSRDILWCLTLSARILPAQISEHNLVTNSNPHWSISDFYFHL